MAIISGVDTERTHGGPDGFSIALNQKHVAVRKAEAGVVAHEVECALVGGVQQAAGEDGCRQSY